MPPIGMPSGVRAVRGKPSMNAAAAWPEMSRVKSSAPNGALVLVASPMQPADVAAHLQRVAAANQRQVVDELIGLALVDALAAGAVAEAVEALDVDGREANLELVRRAAVRPSDQHAVDPEVVFDGEPGGRAAG